MVKILIAMGVILLVTALSVLGSPLLALLIATPAILFYLGLIGLRRGAEGSSGRIEPDSVRLREVESDYSANRGK